MRLFRWCAVSLIIALAFAACGTNATEAPTPEPQSLLTKAAAEVQSAKSVKIKLELSGAPSYVDPPRDLISFVSANGVYVAPDRLSATVTAKIGSLPGQVDVIAIGDEQWMRNPLLTAGKWANTQFSPGFNAGTLISGDSGINLALKSFKNVKLIGRENVFGTDMYHLTGTSDGATMQALTVGLLRGNSVNVDIYIAVDTGRVDHVVMVQPDTVTAKEPKPSTWTLELFDYNAEATVDSPATEAPTAPATEAAEATSAQ